MLIRGYLMKTVDFSLKDKIAVVTGASRGIGEAIARTLAEYNAHVIVVSRKIEGLEKVAYDIKEKGGKVTPYATHVGKKEDIEKLFSFIKSNFGRCDILVNNAATNPYFGPLIDAEESAWDKTFEVNLKGPLFMIQKAASIMKENNGGSIINIASVEGIKPSYFQGIYSTTKAALIMLTKSFALELGPENIRVNAVLPGLTETRFAKALFDNENFYNEFVKKSPLQRHAKPIEIAGAVLYLASDAASFVTGTCITCDGGYLI
jgi:NAD(P)-dependent dehydrogenase (short-subunit alcohol dehydrogenase family)